MSEHEDDDIELLQCQHCDRTFSKINNLMTHKKKEHIENVSICWNFADNACPFGDESCWFQHIIEPNENDRGSGHKSIKCKICGKISNNRNDSMRHRKEEHAENLQMCNLFKKRNCTSKEKCLFSHKSANEETKTLLEKSNEN